MEIKKIEIVLGFECNTKCIFCTSPSMGAQGFSTEQAFRLLADHAEAGVKAVDFGGGEPAVRNDLPALATAAARLGYKQIGVKSNGMRFCYADYAKFCMDCGINEFHVSLWGHPSQSHDRMAGRRGAFEMTEMGLKHLVDFGADVTVDFLVSSISAGFIGDALKHFVGIGVKKFDLWVFSLFGAGGRMAELVPRLGEAGGAVVEAVESLEDKSVTVRTSHIMPCCLRGREEMYFNIKDMKLKIMTPGGSFAGEESPFEKGVHIGECSRCKFHGGCPGPRPEYIRLFGGGGFKAVL